MSEIPQYAGPPLPPRAAKPALGRTKHFMYTRTYGPKTKHGQLISGYKTESELEPGQKLENLVLDSPDGKLYYQCIAKDLYDTGSGPCDLWQTANKELTVRIRRKDGRVDSLAYSIEE